jgi:hypothetical protein
VGELEAGLAEAGVAVPAGGRMFASDLAAVESPEEAWSPAFRVPEGQAYQVGGCLLCLYTLSYLLCWLPRVNA